MKPNEELINEFKKDIMDYVNLKNRFNFRLKEFWDEGIYCLFHNDKILDQDPSFKEFMIDKVREYFFPKSIYNVCFSCDFDFAEETGPVFSLEDFNSIDIKRIMDNIAQRIDSIDQKISTSGVEEHYFDFKNEITGLKCEIDNISVIIEKEKKLNLEKKKNLGEKNGESEYLKNLNGFRNFPPNFLQFDKLRSVA